MKRFETIVGVVVIVALGILLLQRPQTAASQSPEIRATQRSQQQKLQPGSDGEWNAVVEWMERVSPNQIKFLKDNGVDKPAARRVKQLMTEQFRQINGVSDPALRQVLEMKAQLQDNIFGTQLQYRAAKANHSPADMLKAQNELETCVDNLATIEVAIRRARILILNKEIDDLLTPQKRRQWVTSRTKQELNQADAPPGRGGNSDYFASPERKDKE